MTAREIYEAVLVEVNKEQAPSFTLEEFNYLINKAVLAMVNEKYNFFATNQQLSDDLRVLLKRATFKVGTADFTWNDTRSVIKEESEVAAGTHTLSNVFDLAVGDTVSWQPDARDGDGAGEFIILNIADNEIISANDTLVAARGAKVQIKTESVALSSSKTSDRIVSVTLPSSDYLHIVSCRTTWQGTESSGKSDAYLSFPAKRMTFDMLNFIENNVYLRPAANRPYFQEFDNKLNSGLKLSGDQEDYAAYQNKPRFDIHVGRAKTSLDMYSVDIDYLKMPDVIYLNDIDIYSSGEDISQVLELPDYLKNDVVKRISIYLLEKVGDPRTGTQPQINQEIPAIPMNIQMQMGAEKARAQAPTQTRQ